MQNLDLLLNFSKYNINYHIYLQVHISSVSFLAIYSKFKMPHLLSRSTLFPLLEMVVEYFWYFLVIFSNKPSAKYDTA